jgi:hypothetical protein
VVPALLALGAGTTIVSGVELGAGVTGKVLVAVGVLLLALGTARWWRARSRCDRDDRSEARDQEPIACTLDGEGFRERLNEFREVFERGYVGGERLHDCAVRWRFHAAPGLEDDLRTLAEREQQCCRFFRFDVRIVGEEVWWDTRVESSQAGPVLEEFFTLPVSLGDRGPATDGEGAFGAIRA